MGAIVQITLFKNIKKIKTRTFIQRFNYMWVFPIFLVSVPVQWLYRGEIGVSRNSKIGKIVDRLVNLD